MLIQVWAWDFWKSCASPQHSLAAMCMHLSCASNSMALDSGVQERECCNGAIVLGMSCVAFHPTDRPWQSWGNAHFPQTYSSHLGHPGQLWGGEPSGTCMWVYPVGSFQLFLCVCADPTTEPGTGLYLPDVLLF